MQTKNPDSSAAGFSLLELLIAMAVTLVVMAMASTLIAGAFNVRARENQRTEALADAQRALNLMTREISNAGFGLAGNGIVAADSSLTAIRVRANLNAAAGETTSNAAADRDEDITYWLNVDPEFSYIVRLDLNTAAQEMVLANRVDSLRIRYYADKVYYATGNCDITNVQDAFGNAVAEVAQKGAARYVVLTVCVRLPAAGRPGSPGYQPPSSVQLVSDAVLRNADLANY
jgi:prepilin-type N-terminal cleavage/methylation domain-containing protein